MQCDFTWSRGELWLKTPNISEANCGPPTDWPPEALLQNDYSPSAPPMFGNFINFFCPPGYTYGHDNFVHGFKAECRWKLGGYMYQYPEPGMITSDCYKGECGSSRTS